MFKNTLTLDVPGLHKVTDCKKKKEKKREKMDFGVFVSNGNQGTTYLNSKLTNTLHFFAPFSASSNPIS